MAGTGSLLLTVTGTDAPGIAGRLFGALSRSKFDVVDVEQVQVHGRLLLCVELEGGPRESEQLSEILRDDDSLAADGLLVAITAIGTTSEQAERSCHLVTVLAATLDAAALAEIFSTLAGAGTNVDRIVRLSSYPVTSYELTVSGGDPDRFRRDLTVQAARLGVDVAVQASGLHRRAKHLIVLDADSTLLQGEVIDLLATRCGRGEQVASLTAAAMSGEVDFADALRARVALLAGAPESVLADVRDALLLTPGARTLVRTLRRLGYVTAVVSGGFTQVIGGLVADLGIDHLAANVLEVEKGRLTGQLVGAIVDRAGKADALRRFAREAGVPLSQTIAVGDGANDLDMLATAGLGIAFNAKAVVREAADASLSVPYLDAVLFLLGIPREEIEAVDR